MKYEIVERGHRLEAVGAHSGYRIRMSTLSVGALAGWPVTVHVRGSESEDEVRVDVPRHHHASAHEALEHGHACAVLWIDAMNRHRD